jgi:hypothetical protein
MVMPAKVDRKHRTQKVIRNKIFERTLKATRYTQVIFALAMIGFICLLVYLLVQYPNQRQLLNVYNSAPECTAMAGAQVAASSGVCIVKTERIVRLYYEKGGHGSRTYYAVLREESGQTARVILEPGRAFYESAHVGDIVHVQWFDGKIVQLQDGSFSTVTRDHLQWQVKNSKTGFWVCSLFILCSGFVVWMLRPKWALQYD